MATLCSLCGAHGHLLPDCPWQDPAPGTLGRFELEQLELLAAGSDALFLEPRAAYDQAIVGLATRADGTTVLAYDSARVVALLVADGCTEVDAEEWFDSNIACAWLGPGTPVFITRPGAS